MEHIKMSYKIANNQQFSIYLDSNVSEENLVKIASICDDAKLAFYYHKKSKEQRSTLTVIKTLIEKDGEMVLNICPNDDIASLTHGGYNNYFNEKEQTYKEYLYSRHVRHSYPECFFIGDCDFEIN